MSAELNDKTGAPVTIRLDESRAISAYTVHLADGTLAGRADFIDAPEADGERIFFHTEVDEDHGGRGLASLLIGEAVTDTADAGRRIVPVCPFVKSHLEKQEPGPAWRSPTPDETAEFNEEEK